MNAITTFLSDVWRLARPYFRSEEKWSAWILLIAIIALNLSMVGMNVVLNFWNRLFFNSLQTKNYQAFIDLLFTWRRTPGGWIMPGFCGVVAVYIVVSIYATYLNQWLQIRWRRWLTRRFLDEWLADRAYYRISLAGDLAGIGTDNPDQRIAEDVRDFVGTTLSLSVDFLSTIVSFVSFVGILWGLSGEITLLGVAVPGYMVWVALIYAVLGTWLTHLVGRPLIALRFRQQRVEADFRYALVRLRENVEGVALYGGEAEEEGNLQDRFRAVIVNWWSIMIRLKRLNALVAGYSQLAVIFPFVVAAPRYFSGQIELGGLTQTAGAFGRVQDALSWFVNAYATLAQWRAVVERLTGFHRAVVVARAGGQAFTFATSSDGAFHFDDVTLALPDGTRILDRAALELRPGEFGRHYGPVRVRQVDTVPCRCRHLALRAWAHGAASRKLPLSAPAPLYPAWHAAPCRDLSSPTGGRAAGRRDTRAGGFGPCRTGSIPRRGRELGAAAFGRRAAEGCARSRVARTP